MNFYTLIPALAEAAPKGGGGLLGSPMIMMGLMVVFFVVVIIMPQRRKDKERKSMLSKLKAGDKVVSAGGLHGTIHSVKGDTVLLQVDDKVRLTISIGSVTEVAAEDSEKKEEKK